MNLRSRRRTDLTKSSASMKRKLGGLGTAVEASPILELESSRGKREHDAVVAGDKGVG